MNHDQKETALEAIRSEGTMKAGALASGVSVRTLNEEMKRSSIFKNRVLEAREEGKRKVADDAIARIKEYAFNPPLKTDRNVLTAAIALANAYEPGFRGTTTVQGKVDHNVRFITAVPRPNYKILELEKKLLADKHIDNPSKKMLKSSKRTKKVDILDKDGNLIGTQSVEEVEGEVINEKDNSIG